MEGVFAGFVGKISDRTAIRRPSGRAFHNARCTCEVADVALFGGSGEYFTMCFKDGPHAAGRNPRPSNLSRDILQMRPYLGKICRKIDRNLAALAGCQIVDIDFPELS